MILYFLLLVIPLGEKCKRNEQCQNATPNSTCSDGICNCEAGFFGFKGSTVLLVNPTQTDIFGKRTSNSPTFQASVAMESFATFYNLLDEHIANDLFSLLDLQRDIALSIILTFLSVYFEESIGTSRVREFPSQ
ncbi:hypothetical protein CEXT_188681 [Caerostris extrusa]|uniref:EB domain-containing protein n=1 Tax=Caerostris extrusa TaxID=172846 RepID=A0AAV4NJ26_CAEEX|nr:hypothetical protein CEXT_188681 [Caerostris extrusa]